MGGSSLWCLLYTLRFVDAWLDTVPSLNVTVSHDVLVHGQWQPNRMAASLGMVCSVRPGPACQNPPTQQDVRRAILQDQGIRTSREHIWDWSFVAMVSLQLGARKYLLRKAAFNLRLWILMKDHALGPTQVLNIAVVGNVVYRLASLA
jgi:hypothetical protein